MATIAGENFEVGQRLNVDIEKVAHGGHFIARAAGRVFFVRHAIPGENVEIEITSVGSSFLRADVVKVLAVSPDRVQPPCSYSGAGGCGGCDFQHISTSRQRELKADVIKEQFARIAKMEIDVEVEEVAEPLHWRTRISGATDAQGRIGFYAFRSHRVIPVEDCLIAASDIGFPTLAKRKWPTNSRIEIACGEEGKRTVAIGTAVRGSKVRISEGPKVLREQIGGLTVEVSQESFWQSHEKAPATLIDAIRPYVKSGDKVLDLYGGVGLFTAGILDLLEEGRVDLIESSRTAIADAQRNFAEYPNVHIHQGDVAREIDTIVEANLVILDPPREGAGKAVLESICDLNPRSIVYVACDPAALARDSAYLKDLGYELSGLRAFDLFPITHHIECVAHFEASQKG
jgi:tRNA/tmRNA/rRNA uracil-C5-methylase (TrmA/RlmC/RlmD family)